MLKAPAYITETMKPTTGKPSLASVVPLVAVLAHSSNKVETGSMFEVDGDQITKLRWQRAGGILLNPDLSLTPGALLKRWEDVNDFSEPSYPQGPADFAVLLPKAQKMKGNEQGEPITFTGKVVLITGAGGG